ncbi:MAG TPA: hypothetical protein VKX39_16810, partial [Bryobacteraceae bacterium]|nr:hypothetical protein [Bryobacteraceae bacterium]
RPCAAIRSAHSSAFGLRGFASMTLSLMTPQCTADRCVRKSGLRDAYPSFAIFRNAARVAAGDMKTTPKRSQRSLAGEDVKTSGTANSLSISTM